MKVQDVMTRNVAACGVDESLNRAAQLMWECDCGSTPVLDASGSVCGMLTDRDICMAAYTQGLPLTQIPVRNVMSPHLHACRPEDSLEDAQALLQQHKVRRAPVLDGNRLVGILSLGDLVLRSPQHARKEAGLRPEALLQTLVVISTPSGDVTAERDRVAREDTASPHASRNGGGAA